MRRGSTLCAAALGALLAAGSATASQPLADRNVRDPSLRVNDRGEALVTYTRENGQIRHVLAWGALNARRPNPTIPQEQFRIDNAGGWGKYRRLVWKGFQNTCRPYDGPRLVFFVAGCKAADGSFWALQSWQRIQPLRGFPAFRPAHMKYELHLSHWTGPLADLDVSPNWTYDAMWQGLFGRLRYRGEPVYGFRTPSSTRADLHARYFYIDTFNSVWGLGWKRAGAKVTHNPNGGFCFSFVPDRPPPGYPSREIRPAGNGERHRVTVIGPGVTPVIQWEGPGLRRYEATADASFNCLFASMLAGDKVCAAER
ncbi:MAG: hypothetical protein ABR583_12150 [Gaiellaceae bacterium]